MIEDCTCPDCPQCLGYWKGSVNIIVNETWETGNCLYFDISNNLITDASKIATTFYLSLQYC